MRPRTTHRCGPIEPNHRGIISFERVVVADEAVEPGDAVVERARGSVVLFGRPVEPGTAALARDRGDGFDQLGTAALAAHRCIDEQILQVADFAPHPAMGVEEIMGDPDERRGRTAEAGA